MRTSTSGQGRPKGIPNKNTRELKDMILGALHKAGGMAYLTRQAKTNPAVFLTLVGKILPLQVTGKDGGPLEHRMDVPREESREEWLARQAEAAAPAITRH